MHSQEDLLRPGPTFIRPGADFRSAMHKCGAGQAERTSLEYLRYLAAA